MKKSNLLEIIGVIAFLFCSLISCSDSDVNNDSGNDEIAIVPIGNSQTYFEQGIMFTSEGGNEILEFNCNSDWRLEVAHTAGGNTWCTTSIDQGAAGDNVVTITATANESFDDRNVTLTLVAGTVKKTIVVTQKQVDALLLTTNKVEINNKGGDINVEVEANIDYTVEIAESAQGWISPISTRALSTHTLAFRIAPNEEYDKRDGEIYVKSGEKVETVHVYQAGGGIVLLTQNEYPVSDAGEIIAVELKSNCEFDVKMPDVDWITNAPAAKAMSSHTLYYVISANETYDPREAQIVFYDKNDAQVADTLTVIQMQKNAIILSKNEFEIEETGGTFDVELKSNVGYSVNIPDECDWIREVETRALKTEVLHFIVDKLPEREDSRTATITITSNDGMLSNDIVVTQKPKDISTLNVQVEIAGTLSKLIEYETDFSRRDQIKSLILSGKLNGGDFKFIRDTWSTNGPYSLGLLDFSKAAIVEGGEAYLTLNGKSFYTQNNTVGARMFYQSNVRQVILPDNINIADSAFCASAIVSLDIPESVTRIGKRVFEVCYNLEKITIPNSVTSIGEWAFIDCRSLKSISLPQSVTRIENGAFRGCSSLSSVSLPNTLVYIGEWAFGECVNLMTFEIPEGVIAIGTGAFSECGFVKDRPVTVPAKVKYMGNYVFTGYVVRNNPSEIHFKPINPPVEFAIYPAGVEIYDHLPELIYGVQYQDDVTLFVPKGSKDKYIEFLQDGDDYWRWKGFIEE